MTATIAQNSSSSDSLQVKKAPAKGQGTIFFWNVLPIILLLMNIGVSFVKPCVFSKYLPFLAMAAVGAIVRFKTAGWIGSSLALKLALLFCFMELPATDRLWQTGLVAALGLTFFILHLSLMEAGTSWNKLQGEVDETKILYHQSALDSQRHFQLAADREEELKEEIERLKEEAQLRRIEKAHTLECSALIESEIELLTTQKDTILEEARNARVRAAEMELKFQELESQLQTTQAALHQLESRAPVVQTVQVADPAVLKKVEELEIELSLSQEALQQLESRPPIVQTVIVPDPEIVKKAEALEKELLVMQEAVRSQALMPPVIQTVEIADPATQKQLTQVNKELAAAEGRIKQLRAQFEEKTALLAQTRHQLFQVKEELLAQQREETLFQVDKENALRQPLENELVQIADALETSEQEINHLEELVSRILSQ